MSAAQTSLVLSFNGSRLGKHEFNSVIKWIYPCNPTTKGRKTVVCYALLNLNGHDHPIILKRNCSGNNDQIVADELKPLFGLTKMGTHQIRLHGIPRKYYENSPWVLDTGQLNFYIYPQWSDYFIFRATTTTGENNACSFISMPILKDTPWLPTTGNQITSKHKLFYYEIQKIFVFRDLLKINDTNLSNILVRSDSTSRHGRPVPLSIDEMNIKLLTDGYRKPHNDIEQFFFPRTTTRTEVLVRMLGLTQENHVDQIEILRNSISLIITRVAEDKLWMVNEIIEQIVDKVSLYFSVICEKID